MHSGDLKSNASVTRYWMNRESTDRVSAFVLKRASIELVRDHYAVMVDLPPTLLESSEIRSCNCLKSLANYEVSKKPDISTCHMQYLLGSES